MSYEELQGNYGQVLDRMFYYGLLAAIPKLWKIIIKENDFCEPNDIEGNMTLLENTGKPSSSIYWTLIENNFIVNDASRILWERELGSSIDVHDWQIMYKTLRKEVKSTKLLCFQFRLLHRALSMNVQLNKWKTDWSPKCTFCSVKDETILHLILECPKVHPLWSALQKFIKYYLGITNTVRPISNSPK